MVALLHGVALLAIVSAVSGCNRPEAQVPVSSTDLVRVDTGCAFCADPGFVRTCDVAAGVRTTLYWNLQHTGVDRVAIYVVDEGGKEVPVSEEPPSGSIETGAWLRPGLTFKVKDLHGNLLDTLVIAGRGC